MKENKIKIDVVSDVACPWCYVGKRHLEAALEQWDGAPVEVTWHPFQLDPNLPSSGQDRQTYMTQKFGDVARMEPMFNHLKEKGKSVGIDFDFGDNWLAVNTLPLHQLLNEARKEGFAPELKERFLNGYFEKTEHLNDRTVLYAILQEFGWSSEKVDQIIDNEQIARNVQEEIAHYQSRGVSGVPFFVFNDQFGMSGAQPVEVFLEALSSLDVPVGSTAEACDVDGTNC